MNIKFILLVISFLLISCETKVQKTSKLSLNQMLGNGEWLDSSDTLNGISIRGNRIAFFTNMKFTSSQVREYTIIDSICKNQEHNHSIGEYIVAKGEIDTIVFKIEKRNKKSIVLVNSKQIPKVFNFWKHTKFREK
jgi:hypothetical protein